MIERLPRLSLSFFAVGDVVEWMVRMPHKVLLAGVAIPLTFIIRNANKCKYTYLHMIEMHAVVTGTVQGVRYRTYVQEAATELGLVGSVQNNADGTVIVVAQGLPDELKAFVEYLNEGSLQAKVEGVSVEWRSIKKPYHEFSILF